MRGCCLLLLALFTLPFLGVSQAPAPAPREQVLQHLAGKVGDPGNYRSHLENIRMMGTNAVPILIEILGSQPALTNQWHEKAPETIRARMTPTQYHVRLQYEASQCLYDMTETQDFLPALISLLQDPRNEVRRQAAWALSRHAHKADKDLLLTVLPVLRDSESEVRNMMVSVFSGSAELPSVKAALEETLHDSNEGVRSGAAYTLLMNADRNHAAALDTLVSLFSSTNVQTRYFAAHYYTISNPGNQRLETRLIPIYTNVLSVGDTNLQALAMKSLSRYGRRAQQVVPQLQVFLTSPHLGLREAATNALQEIQPETLPGNPAAPASRELVLQHLQAIYSTNQAVAFQSIKAMGTNAIPFLIEILGYQPTQADQWYEKAYAKAPSGIQSQMSKPEALTKLRDQAQLILRNMPDTQLYLKDLAPLLQDPRVEVRRSAAYLLGSMSYRADKTETLVYISALKDSDPDVRRLIAYAFTDGGASLPRAKAALEAALNDPVEEVRLSVANALLKADKNHTAAQNAFKSLLASPNLRTRNSAAKHYFTSDPQRLSKDPEMLKVFVSILSGNDVNLQADAARSLGNWGNRAKAAVPELQKLLLSPDATVRASATNALQRIAPQVLPPVKP